MTKTQCFPCHEIVLFILLPRLSSQLQVECLRLKRGSNTEKLDSRIRKVSKMTKLKATFLVTIQKCRFTVKPYKTNHRIKT